MEIYGQARQMVEFSVPEGAEFVSVSASLNDGDEKELFPTPESLNSVTKKVRLPYVDTEGALRLFWKFRTETFGSSSEEVTVVKRYDIVTPILEKSDILQIHPNATEDEIVAIEKATRHIIMSHTGQKFGKYSGKRRVVGDGGSSLRLPQRLIRLKSFNGLENSGLTVDPTGWVVKGLKFGAPTVKADANGWHMHTGGVIHDPNNMANRQFSAGTEYVVEGDWGWEAVPSAVREAAKLLVNDYACANAGYRDRYLTSMTAADWRIQFHSAAFEQTGNVRADQLLREYVLKRGWAVI